MNPPPQLPVRIERSETAPAHFDGTGVSNLKVEVES